MEKPKLRRGFNAISPERQREIASLGGRAVHEQGKAPEWPTRADAIRYGRQGGLASGRAKRQRRAATATDETADLI